MPSRAWVVTLLASCLMDLLLLFQCPLGLIPHFYTERASFIRLFPKMGFNALSGLYLISTKKLNCRKRQKPPVSRPSRAYTSFLRCQRRLMITLIICFNALSGLYLISTPSIAPYTWTAESCFNALSGLYLISTVPLQKPRFYAVSRAYFCRYLSEYSDNSRFSCMLTFWTYLMRCTYPWHWIKYSTNYNRCHPIFSLSW